MDANKIKERFETRKNVTENALKDFTQICDWITETVDNVNIRIEKKINFRGSKWNSYSNSMSKYASKDGDTLELAVIHGECGLFFIENNDFYDLQEISLDFLDYINLKDLQESFEEMFKALESFSTREDSANKITSILNIINQ